MNKVSMTHVNIMTRVKKHEISLLDKNITAEN